MSSKHFSPEAISERRFHAVRLRLDGVTVAETARKTGLSAPTVSAAWKAFREGGWAAVPVRERGRHKGQATSVTLPVQQALWHLVHQLPTEGAPGWTSAVLAEKASDGQDVALTQRGVEHWWQEQGLKTQPWPLEEWAGERSPRGRWYRQIIQPVWRRLPRASQRWQGGVRCVFSSQRKVYQLYFHGPRGRLWMRCFTRPPLASDYIAAFEALAGRAPAGFVFHGADMAASPEIQAWLARQPAFWLLSVPPNLATV
ncbi:helix-turn-helix domain-containing protein [Vreelandella subglaciescola]|uniref:helix-turn-helix domain-containing protein n=1 Tax=Vreelandella subglaciescola TaxID=29571 RepID=UPI0009A6E0E0|nr:helix-turn-helix domain-containing protein [Halomonas subglaciescola]